MATKTEEKPSEDKLIAARNKNLDLAIQQIAKDYGDGAIMRLGDEKIVDIEVIPTGNILIDRALGVGGFPRGRVVEVYGPESPARRRSRLRSSPRRKSAAASRPSSTSSTRSIRNMRASSASTWMICWSRSRAPARKRSGLSRRWCAQMRSTSSCSIRSRRSSRNRNWKARSATPPSARRRA